MAPICCRTSKKMKPRPRRSRLVSFLLCSTAIHPPYPDNKLATFSPPLTSLLECDDESISNETVAGIRMDEESEGPAWSSLASRFRNSPSPVCSTCSPVGSESSASGVDCNFSTPRNQSPSKISVSISTVEIDEWIRDGRKHPYQPARQGDEGKTWMSCSSVYESAMGGNDQVTLPSIHEEENNVNENEEESPFLAYHKLLNRPKPYHDFLNEFEKQEVDSKANAQHFDHIQKLRKREAAISEWEKKETRKAVKEVAELKSKQKKEMAKAKEKLLQKLDRIRSKATEKTAKERVSCVSDEANFYSGMVQLSI
uniref:Remorin C-terminal domain-containing protein n=1 Tax=Kalanchoe fedtschenkoi TaxID=63787 RepID=A0A7N0SZI9_KALFE